MKPTSYPLKRALFGLCLPNPKPWHLVVSPNPFLFGSQAFHLKLDPDFDVEEYKEWNPFAKAAKNVTGMNIKVETPMLQGIPASLFHNRWVELRDLGASSNRKQDAGSLKPIEAKTHDGLTLKQVLAELLKQFHKHQLDSDLSALKVIASMEKRLGEVAEFREPRKPQGFINGELVELDL